MKILTKFDDEQIKILSNFACNEYALDEFVTSNEYHFRDLDWRVETKLASRFCDTLPLKPKIAMKFHVDKNQHSEPFNLKTRKEIFVQADINNLVHIISKLESVKNSMKKSSFQ